MILLVVAMQGAEHVDAKTIKDNLSGYALLDRDDKWTDKFSNKKEFKEAEKTMHAYVTDDHPRNGWNAVAKKNTLQIYNFDTTAGSLEAGLNVLLMHVQYQMAEGIYTPTEAERKLHEWIVAKIGTAKAPDNVDAKHVRQVISAYNENANYGNVPTALFKSDSEYWMGVISDKLCDLDKTCDPETGEILPDCSPVQCADATTWSTYHTLSIAMVPYSCIGGNPCRVTDYEAGTGTLSASLHGYDVHSTSTRADYYIRDQSYVGTYPVSHALEGYAQIKDDKRAIGPLMGANYIYVDDTMTFSVECGGRENNCGTFVMGITAQPATFET